MNGDRDGDGVGTRTGVEASERTQDGNGDGAGTGTGTGVESRGRTQDGNEDGSGDGNESSSGDGDRDGIGEGGGEAKKLKNCTRVVNATWEAGETWVEREKHRQESVSSKTADPDNLEKRIAKKLGGGGIRYPGLK